MVFIDLSPSPMESASQTLPAQSGKPNFWDWLFLLFLACATLAVVGIGVLAYEEGHKTELIKRNGEAWGEFLAEHSAKRTTADYEIEACAAREGTTWGECYQALVAPGAPLDDLNNPFFDTPQKLVAQCDPNDRSLRGALVMDKVVATPPGSAVPVVSSPLEESEPIDKKLQIRVTVCDKFSSPIVIGEFSF
jgi:hypothetical protein